MELAEQRGPLDVPGSRFQVVNFLADCLLCGTSPPYAHWSSQFARCSDFRSSAAQIEGQTVTVDRMLPTFAEVFICAACLVL